MLNIPHETIYEVADTIEAEKKPGYKVDWIHKVTGEINKKQEHCEKVQQT